MDLCHSLEFINKVWWEAVIEVACEALLHPSPGLSCSQIKIKRNLTKTEDFRSCFFDLSLGPDHIMKFSRPAVAAAIVHVWASSKVLALVQVT